MSNDKQIEKELSKRIKKIKWNHYLSLCSARKNRIEQAQIEFNSAFTIIQQKLQEAKKELAPCWDTIELESVNNEFLTNLTQQIKTELNYKEPQKISTSFDPEEYLRSIGKDPQLIKDAATLKLSED